MITYSVYITTNGPEEAESIARTVLEDRLAACVNIFTPIHSIYRWQGRIHSDTEVAMIVKTSEPKLSSLINKVRELHSYSCPCIEAFPIETGNADFLEWIADSCDENYGKQTEI